MRSSVLIAMLAGVLLVAGCGKKSNTKDDAGAASTTVPAATDTGAETSGAAGDDVAAARPLDDAAQARFARVLASRQRPGPFDRAAAETRLGALIDGGTA